MAFKRFDSVCKMMESGKIAHELVTTAKPTVGVDTSASSI